MKIKNAEISTSLLISINYGFFKYETIKINCIISKKYKFVQLFTKIMYRSIEEKIQKHKLNDYAKNIWIGTCRKRWYDLHALVLLNKKLYKFKWLIYVPIICRENNEIINF